MSKQSIGQNNTQTTITITEGVKKESISDNDLYTISIEEAHFNTHKKFILDIIDKQVNDSEYSIFDEIIKIEHERVFFEEIYLGTKFCILECGLENEQNGTDKIIAAKQLMQIAMEEAQFRVLNSEGGINTYFQRYSQYAKDNQNIVGESTYYMTENFLNNLLVIIDQAEFKELSYNDIQEYFYNEIKKMRDGVNLDIQKNGESGPNKQNKELSYNTIEGNLYSNIARVTTGKEQAQTIKEMIKKYNKVEEILDSLTIESKKEDYETEYILQILNKGRAITKLVKKLTDGNTQGKNNDKINQLLGEFTKVLEYTNKYSDLTGVKELTYSFEEFEKNITKQKIEEDNYSIQWYLDYQQNLLEYDFFSGNVTNKKEIFERYMKLKELVRKLHISGHLKAGGDFVGNRIFIEETEFLDLGGVTDSEKISFRKEIINKYNIPRDSFEIFYARKIQESRETVTNGKEAVGGFMNEILTKKEKERDDLANQAKLDAAEAENTTKNVIIVTLLLLFTGMLGYGAQQKKKKELEKQNQQLSAGHGELPNKLPGVIEGNTEKLKKGVTISFDLVGFTDFVGALSKQGESPNEFLINIRSKAIDMLTKEGNGFVCDLQGDELYAIAGVRNGKKKEELKKSFTELLQENKYNEVGKKISEVFSLLTKKLNPKSTSTQGHTPDDNSELTAFIYAVDFMNRINEENKKIVNKGGIPLKIKTTLAPKNKEEELSVSMFKGTHILSVIGKQMAKVGRGAIYASEGLIIAPEDFIHRLEEEGHIVKRNPLIAVRGQGEGINIRSQIREITTKKGKSIALEGVDDLSEMKKFKKKKNTSVVFANKNKSLVIPQGMTDLETLVNDKSIHYKKKIENLNEDVKKVINASKIECAITGMSSHSFALEMTKGDLGLNLKKEGNKEELNREFLSKNLTVTLCDKTGKEFEIKGRICDCFINGGEKVTFNVLIVQSLGLNKKDITDNSRTPHILVQERYEEASKSGETFTLNKNQ